MARRPDLEKFAAEHGLKLGTIADLIEYRNQHETTVEKVSHCQLPTEFGQFELVTFRDTIDNQLHYALCKGDLASNPSPLVRVHVHDFFSDVLHTDRHTKLNWPLHRAMKRIADEGGVVVILGQNASQEELLARVEHFAAEDRGEPLPGAKRPEASRRVGVGSQILRSLGVRRMRLLTGQKRYHALSGFGLEVEAYLAE